MDIVENNNIRNDDNFKLTSGVLGHNRIPINNREKEDNMEMDNEEESFDQNFQHYTRVPVNQSESIV
jgi:hypothetical protein